MINHPLFVWCVCVFVEYIREHFEQVKRRFQPSSYRLPSLSPHPRAPSNPTATIITLHSSIHHALFSLCLPSCCQDKLLSLVCGVSVSNTTTGLLRGAVSAALPTTRGGLGE